MSREHSYKADEKYLEDCTFIVIAEMLERLPRLKPRIKRYLETFPGKPGNDSRHCVPGPA